MATWAEFEAEAPEFAATVQARLEASGLAFLATLRRDGSPRVSAIEPSIALGELWIGMMPDSLKGRDLQRDPRLALHAASIDKDVKEGDAKLAGSAIEVTNPETTSAYLSAVHGPDAANLPANMQLFAVDILEASTLWPEGAPTPDYLAIRIWRAGGGTRLVKRY